MMEDLDRRGSGLLEKVIRIANSRVRFEKKLQNILKTTAAELGFESGFLFLLNMEQDTLVLQFAGDEIDDWPFRKSYKLGEDLLGTAGLERKVVQGPPVSEKSSAVKDTRSILALPVSDDTFLYGVMAFLHTNEDYLTPETTELLHVIGVEVGGALQNFRVSMEAKRRVMELNALFEVSKAISAATAPGPMVRSLVTICAHLVSARWAAFTVLDKHQQVIAQATFGSKPQSSLPPLCVSLDLRKGCSGDLCVMDKVAWQAGETRPFDAEDESLLKTVSSFISSALDKSIMFTEMETLAHRNEVMVKTLSSLYDISSAMMTTVDFEEILDIVLNAIIHSEALGFDRAIILLLDTDEKKLRLHQCRVRTNASDEASAAEGFPPCGEGEITIPYAVESGPPAACLITPEPRNVKDPKKVSSPPAPLGDMLSQPYVAVPLRAKGKRIGTVLADHFLTGRRVTEDELQNLCMLTRQAGLALENSRLYAFIENVNRELKDARERLIETEKMAALGEIASGIAHEIRNPLVSIGGFARRLARQMDAGTDSKNYADLIVNEVSRLENTLKDVLDFSYDSTGSFQYFDLNSTIVEALLHLRLDMEERRIVAVKDFGDLPRAFGDRRQIRHVFFNLCLNAVQAMEPGSVLHIRTLTTSEQGKDFITCVVQDTGGGIPAEILHNIFNPFFTTKAQGSGLGLAIVHKIVTRHQGDIIVENLPGKGASFIVKLPCYFIPTGLSA